jgi:hypothetical protein
MSIPRATDPKGAVTAPLNPPIMEPRTNIQVNRTHYKNIYVHNAVTVVHHDTFVKGRHVDVKPTENPFLKDKINVGRPDIKPEKTTHMPVVKEVPQAKRPPEPIREMKVKEIKEKRPLVKEREASVLKPQSPPKEMTLKVKEGKGAYERDSVIFEIIEYEWHLLACLLWIAACNNNSLRVLDYGGSLGSLYYQHRDFLKYISDLRWTVVEQKSFVKCGKEQFENEHLKFEEFLDKL